jgi:fumarylacetoacetase
MMTSWLDIATDSDFSIYNFPYGVFSVSDSKKRAASAIGDYILDLDAFHKQGYFDNLSLAPDVFISDTLNDFIKLGKATTNGVRSILQKLFTEDHGVKEKLSTLTFQRAEVEMHMPVEIKDYTDFYSSREHATNVGTMFRGKENALMPNWLHLPVGYHGRASSIVVSGTDIKRPMGQMRPDKEAPPVFGASRLMDFELEMGFIIGKETKLGQRISTTEAEDYIFGLILFNDWSARDIQGWEYVPLGPFLGKNFGSTVAPWIVPLEALDPFRINGPKQEPKILPYLEYQGDKRYNINLEVSILTEAGSETIISKSNFKYMYWNMCQQLAHHTINGCNVNVGDLYASGTISGTTEDSFGSMLELTWRGSKPLTLEDGTERKFLQDGDSLILRGHGEKDGIRVGFGESRGKVIPADTYTAS